MQPQNSLLVKTALIYGLLAGLVVISSMIIGIASSGGTGFGTSMAFGYLIMLIAFSLIFVGIKRHRDTVLGGEISFGRALGLGTLMAAFAGIAYVAVWELYLHFTDHAFIDNYIAQLTEAKQSKGFSAEELKEEMIKLDEIRATYANPLMRIPITFTEIFPVGFVVALVCSALLRTPGFMKKT